MEIRDGEYFCKVHEVKLIERDAPGRTAAGHLAHNRAFVCPVSGIELETFPDFGG
jgi:hypothetical protein